VTRSHHAFVVPAYGQSPHLRECLESLRKQTRPSPVVICTSTPYEGLQALAEEFDARLVVHGPNAGIGRDWNYALGEARSDWVTLAHQDDIYLPEFAQASMDAAQRRRDASLVLTGYDELLADQVRSGTLMLGIKRLLLELGFLGRAAIATRGAKRRLLRLGCPVPCPAVTLRLPITTPFFREDLKVNLDWDAWLRMACLPGEFAYVRTKLMLHRIHSGSETSDAIEAGVRATEDLMVFRALWPEPVARLLARLYAVSYEKGAEPWTTS